MSALGTLTVSGVTAFVKGISESEKLRVRYMRQEMKRGAQRMRKSFIRAQLQGAPGIKGGPLAKGKNVFTFVGGDRSSNVRGKIGISRILNVHEQGMTIRPSRGNYLAIREHAGTARERVVALVPQVVIPARLKFAQQIQRESPAVLRKVAEASYRGTEQAMIKAMKQTVGLNG